MKLKQEIIDELLGVNYFINISKPNLGNLDFRCEFVSTIKQAMKTIDGIKWENIRTDKIGDVSSYLCVNHKDIYNGLWNEIVADVKAAIVPFVYEQIKKLAFDDEIKKVLRVNVSYDIVGITMALFYRDYFISEFYDRLLQIYKAGYLPCGWKGKGTHSYFVVH